MATNRQRSSPMDLRDDGTDHEVLEPYQPPRMLASRVKIEQSPDRQGQMSPKVLSTAGASSGPSSKEQRTWLSRLSSSSKARQDFRSKLSRRIARLSSLDSTRSSSSVEDPSYNQREPQQHINMPIISITNNDQPLSADLSGPTQLRWPAQFSERPPEKPSRQLGSISQRRADFYRQSHSRSSFNRSRNDQKSCSPRSQRRARDVEDDDDEDAFDDVPLPMPYSSSSMSYTIVRQQTECGISYPSGFNGRLEELLDDRQGMNNSEQQFTKAEKQANRASIDGSIISNEFCTGPKTMQGSSSAPGSRSKLASMAASGKGKDKRRSKSPSFMYRSRRHSRRGFLGLVSRLKLTKKHESIARLQLSILNSGFVSLKTLDRNLQSFLPRERLSIPDIQKRVKLMRQFEVLSTIEYRFASKYETYVCKHAQTEINQPKNNYKKCIPYDYNRIVLKTLPNVPDSDYINASHVDSCLKPNAYIAAQGPNEFTIEDFWRMIWEQKTFVIVMLTKVFDFIRVMCNQYWPVELNKPERYGRIEVTLLQEEPLADFVIRTIKISKLRASATRAKDIDGALSPDGKLVASNGTLANHLKVEERGLVSESEEEYLDNYNSDDTLGSGAFEEEEEEEAEVIERNEFETPMSGNSLSVRSPRFVASPSSERRSAARERSLPPKQATKPGLNLFNSQNHLSPPHTSKSEKLTSQTSSHFSLNGGHFHNGVPSSTISEQVETPLKVPRLDQPAKSKNEFLHPLFNAHQQLGASSNSLSSEPASPLTPRTPSSAGIDRSSATRKAVKKKRRERLENQRPKRTQFMVPTESQLEDDDDDDEDLLPGDMSAEINEHASDQTQEANTTKKNNERIIYQFHYNSWASHTCPFISSLLHFRRRVRICMDEMSKSGKTGPTVVHCNDGCGRTGAYLCIDANLELAEEDNVIDIYNYTRKMRQSRKYLIENLEQYKFVYDTIEEALFCGRTWFPVSELHKRLKQKAQRNPITRKNEYLLEYERICRMTTKFSIGDCAGGHRVENREKNRDVSTVPPDNFRPYLSSFQTNDSTDYINAVFVDGYTRSKEYIVTEWPLHKTISDFWSLVYDHDCNSVILLANPGESTTYPSFLPSEKELRRKFGPVFSAEMVSYTHYQNIKSWIYTINKKIVSLTEVIARVKSEAKTTQVFQITCWPQGHRVPTSTNALVELMNMVERWRQRTTYGPVCVVSLNGKSRAGVYCAANVAIEQVVQHSEVDVFNAVKTVRRHRPQLIENMTEYKYCYDLILHYVLHYVNNHSATNS